MSLKALLILLFTSTSTITTFAQEAQGVLSSPNDWKSELMVFPLGFAPSIDFTGIEDLRFRSSWSDSTSQEFWTYTFVWYIDNKFNCTETNLSEILNSYYDGLMGIDERNKEAEIKLDKTTSLIHKSKDAYSGEIRVYDAFFTKKYMTLNVKITNAICTQDNKQLIVFELSTQDFENAVWDYFNEIELTVNCD